MPEQQDEMETDVEPAPDSGGDYEFAGSENATIERLGASASIWGYTSMAISAVVMVGGLFMLFSYGGPIVYVLALILGVVYALMGILYARAGRKLKAVVDTEGRDVPLLMNAIDGMGVAFRVELYMTTAVIVYVVLQMLLSRAL